MTTTGYSDRINHALAFAAKHHDRQVRKGLRLPYFTQPASVGIILTRYGRPDETVVAGVLHDVVEDCVRQGAQGDDPMLERVAAKFGAAVVELLLQVTERRYDDDGVELSPDERREDLLARLGSAGEEARWVRAAVQLHEIGTLLADLGRTDYPEAVWERFRGGRDGAVRYFADTTARLRASAFAAPIVTELEVADGELAGGE